MSTQIKKNDNWVTVAGGTIMQVGTKVTQDISSKNMSVSFVPYKAQ